MLNICDYELLGKTITNHGLKIEINQVYYGEKKIDDVEAKYLLKKSTSVNMVGKQIISLSVSLGIGTLNGVKEIDGIPFLIVFKM
ncbi:uncharacterized protein METZ01_LOCUS99446 [marine metagenome]|uniref:DUF424 domain-containing protein n=1 Tax=marine metagenome TaxID=408172 RepID=A0A381W288_9ZZZZ